MMTSRPPVGAPLLNWQDGRHWSTTPEDCRYCGQPTHLRDSKRKAAHKTCAEEALATQAAEAADAYQNGHLR